MRNATVANATVADVMTTAVHTATPAMPLKELARVLAEHGLSALPVLDPDGRVVGVVSERDLLAKQAHPIPARRRWWQRHPTRVQTRRARGDTVGDVLTAPAVTVRPTATLAEAAALLVEHEVKHLPVLADGGELVGVVSRGDLVRRYLRSDTDIRDAVLGDIIGRILLTDPRAVAVTVVEGVVTLEGFLERRTDTEIAERLVRRMDGVVDVVNALAYGIDDGRLGDHRSARTGR